MTTPGAALDLIVRGGTVIDGSRAPRFDADVGVAGGVVVEIGDLAAHRARRVIDATGRIVAPGFIDAHTHDDQAVVSTPLMPFKVSQGVTTVVTGNCGISLAPLAAGAPMPAPLDLLDIGQRARFGRFGEYLAALDRAPASVNVAGLAGHLALRAAAMDAFDRAARPAEIAAMRALLAAALDEGALGLSTGTAYAPAAAAPTEEIVEVGRPLAAAGGLYATHLRNEGDAVVEALDEAFAIGQALGVPVVLSHHKLQGRRNWGRSGETLARIERAMRCQCVALDCYPYEASATVLRTDGDRLAHRLLVASSEPHPECAGQELADIARRWGTSEQDAARRLQPAQAVYFMMDEADVRRILAFEQTMVASDGIPGAAHPHPRLWGTFPRVLGRYSRELALFALETAVWKMTGLPAQRFGLVGRGRIAPGAAADLVVFDAQQVADRATYEAPETPAAGIEAVVVNGEPTWVGGRHTGARAGRALRRRPGGPAPQSIL